MTKPLILVTGATGRTGSAVTHQLLRQGYRVRALVRRDGAAAQRLRAAGADIAIADLFDPEQILQAMRGANRAYYCPPFHAHMLHATATFAVAAQQSTLESIVGLTQWLASPSHPSLSTRQHWLTDRLLGTLPGIAHTTVAPGFFASYPYLALIGYAAHLGLFPLPVDGESRNAPPSDQDIARVAVAALIDPANHDGRTYRPTGPDMISVNDMAQILGKVLGRTVRHVRLPMWLFLKAARMEGVNNLLLSNLPSYLREQNEGTFAFGGPTDHVLAVTGHHPENFETIARRHAALPQAQRSAGNSLRTLAAFVTVPFRPGINQSRYQHRQGFPMAASPRLAIEDAQWRSDHEAIARSAGIVPLRLAVPA